MVNFSSFNSTLSSYRLFTQIFASSRLTICKKVLDEKFFRLSFFVLLSHSLKKDYSLPELCTHFPKFFSLPDTIGPDYVSLITITRLQSGKKGRFINLFFLLFLHFSESPRKTGFFFLRAVSNRKLPRLFKTHEYTGGAAENFFALVLPPSSLGAGGQVVSKEGNGQQKNHRNNKNDLYHGRFPIQFSTDVFSN